MGMRWGPPPVRRVRVGRCGRLLTWIEEWEGPLCLLLVTLALWALVLFVR